MRVGDPVAFTKQASKVATIIPLNSVGVLCEKTDDAELNCYVIFDSLNDSDWFNEDELENLGD